MPDQDNPFGKHLPQPDPTPARSAGGGGGDSGYDAASRDYRPSSDFAEETARGLMSIVPGADLENTLGTGANLLTKLKHAAGRQTGYTAEQAEEVERSRLAEQHRQAMMHHPWVSTGEEVLGGALNPATYIGEGALAARGVGTLGRAAAIGGATGAAQGWNESKGQSFLQRVEAAAGEGAGGAVAGAGLHVGGTIVGGVFAQAAQKVRSAIESGKVSKGWKPGMEPTPRMIATARRNAARELSGLREKSDPTRTKLGGVGAHGPEMNRAQARGAPIMAAEALGPNATGKLKALSKTPGTTRDTLRPRLGERAATAPERVLDVVGTITDVDPAAVAENFDRVISDLRAQGGEAAKAYRAFEDLGIIDSPALERTARTPAGRAAARQAITDMRNAHLEPREYGVVERLTVEDKPERAGDLRSLKHRETKNVMREEVEINGGKAKFWDFYKRALDAEVNRFKDKNGILDVGQPGAKGIIDLAREVRDIMTDPNTRWGPVYARALEEGGEAPRMVEAYRKGATLMRAGIDEARFNLQTRRFTPAQWVAFRASVVKFISDQFAGGVSSLKTINLMLTRGFKNKLVTTFGPERAEAISKRIEDEQFLLREGNRMANGSDTFELGVDDRDVRRAAQELHGIFHYGAEGVKIRWGRVLEKAVDLVLTPYYKAQVPMDQATRDIMGAMLQSSPTDMIKFLQRYGAKPGEATRVTKMLARVGAFQAAHAGTVAGLSGAAALHALLTKPAIEDPETDEERARLREREETGSDPENPFGKGARPTSAGATPPVEDSGAKQITNAEARQYFTKTGWSPVAAAGIAANLMAESSGDATVVNASDHAGLAQWDEKRQKMFRQMFGKALSSATAQEQMAFVNWELTKGPYRSVGAALRLAKTPAEAADIVLRGYEKPKNLDYESQRREAIAEGRAPPPRPAGVEMAEAGGGTPRGEPASDGGEDWSGFAPQ